jgi:hypothetical protein
LVADLSNNLDMSTRNERISTVLRSFGRTRPQDWGYDLSSKRDANRFLFTSAMDYQMKSDTIWHRAKGFVEDELGNPTNLWETIRSFSLSKWRAKCAAMPLHRFPQVYTRHWRIAEQVQGLYRGDARRIWRSCSAQEALEAIGMGPQLSRMTVGALKDEKQVTGCALVKADLHVRRVIGRVFDGEQVTEARATELTQELHPRDPWKLDNGLFQLGRAHCRPAPDCGNCPLRRDCCFAKSN